MATDELKNEAILFTELTFQKIIQFWWQQICLAEFDANVFKRSDWSVLFLHYCCHRIHFHTTIWFYSCFTPNPFSFWFCLNFMIKLSRDQIYKESKFEFGLPASCIWSSNNIFQIINDMCFRNYLINNINELLICLNKENIWYLQAQMS